MGANRLAAFLTQMESNPWRVDYLPENWKNARATPMAIPRNNRVFGVGDPSNDAGAYKALDEGPFNPSRMEVTKEAQYNPEIQTHERMHAAWHKDFDKFDRDQWERMFKGVVGRPGPSAYHPAMTAQFNARGEKTYEPTANEALAYLFWKYLTDPEGLKQAIPEAYHFFLQKTGGK